MSYYDHYNFDRTGGDDFTYDNAHFSGQPATRSTSTRGMATGSKRNVLDANGNTTAYWITGAVFYDNYDRPVQTQTNNHLHTAFTAATLDKSTIVYDFVKALRTKTSHYQNAATAVHLEDRNQFDHAGRVLKTFRRINGGVEQQLAQYEYNALGQLVDKKLHNTGDSTFLQSVDYRYNIRGWLTSINNAQLVNDTNVTNDETTDYFGLELSYNTVVSGLANTPHYNGNISAVRYKAAHAGAASLESTNGTRAFKYTYDKSDRLTAAAFAAQDNSGGWTKQLNTLNETMTYDANGNILTLARNQNNRGITTSGGLQLTSTAQTIDQLTYTYASAGTGSQNSNLMIKVEDAIGGTVGQTGFVNGVNTATEYTYTVDGSLIADQNKGISSIVYIFLGKPQTINYTSGRRVEYTYDAAGTKLTVRTYQAATLLTTTNYSGGFVYEGASPALSFFSSPEGRVVRNGANFEYQYAIADHQGNTRLIFSSVTPAPVSQTATFENPANDATVFGRVPTTSPHWATFVAANNTPGGNKVIRLNQNYPVAATRSIRVYPGETVSAEVWCYYEGGSYSASQGITPWITAVATAFGGVSGGGGESGSIFNGVNNAIGTFGMSGNQGTNRPAAYLNYIIFDQQYKVINMGWTVVPTSANFARQRITVNAPQIKEPGFVFVYLSYENAGTTFVNFDDINVTHTRNNIIQYNEYYAFQHTTANSWTRENVTGNNFLANGGTELNPTTQLYDLDFRNYDPLLGRMNGVDPVAAKYSSLTPYNYSYNNPTNHTDPSGADPGVWFQTGSVQYPGYTYDDKEIPRQREYICGMCWRDGDGMGRYGRMTGRTGGMGAGWKPSANSFFAGFNSWVDGQITQRENRKAQMQTLAGISEALRTTEFGGNVNLATGSVSAFSQLGSFGLAASHAIQYGMTAQAGIAMAYIDLQKQMENPNYALAIASLGGWAGWMFQPTQGGEPTFQELWDNYPMNSGAYYKDKIWGAIGGKVKQNHDSNPTAFANSCTIRMSKAFNDAGYEIPFMKGQTLSGADGNWYYYRVKNFDTYVTGLLGAPDITGTNISSFQGKQGIIEFQVNGWGDASGHFDLWNGSTTAIQEYWNNPGLTNVKLWVLK